MSTGPKLTRMPLAAIYDDFDILKWHNWLSCLKLRIYFLRLLPIFGVFYVHVSVGLYLSFLIIILALCVQLAWLFIDFISFRSGKVQLFWSNLRIDKYLYKKLERLEWQQ